MVTPGHTAMATPSTTHPIPTRTADGGRSEERADASSVRPVRMQPQITSTTSTASDANGLSTR
jgi:hypothetical protein